MRLLTTLVCLTGTALTATADEVVLRNGAVFEGVVHETGDRVVVKMAVGSMSFKKIDVAAIRKSDDAMTLYERKLATATTPDAWFELAAWAREKGLGKQADGLLQKAIDQEPDHAGARRALGYEKHDGKWMRFDELMHSKGFVKVGDGWQPKDVVESQRAREAQERLQAARLADAVKAREVEDLLVREKLALERRALETQKELEMQRIVLERERLEILKRRDLGRTWDPFWDPHYFPWAPSALPTRPHVTGVAPGFEAPHHPGHSRPRPVPSGPAPLWTPPVR